MRWSYQAPSPGDLPGVNLLFDALDRSPLTELGSAPLPPVGPDDHVRGPAGAPLVVVYGDYECPFCAALEERLRALPLRVAFRHFPRRSAHPRAFAAACAAEAAGRQGAFWPMHDALFADQGRLEDPHLWARAERLGLDVARFDADRRSGAGRPTACRPTSAAACAPACRPRRRCSSTAERHAGPPGRRAVGAARLRRRGRGSDV